MTYDKELRQKQSEYEKQDYRHNKCRVYSFNRLTDVNLP
jgi:hypothetical protein